MKFWLILTDLKQRFHHYQQSTQFKVQGKYLTCWGRFFVYNPTQSLNPDKRATVVSMLCILCYCYFHSWSEGLLFHFHYFIVLFFNYWRRKQWNSGTCVFKLGHSSIQTFSIPPLIRFMVGRGGLEPIPAVTGSQAGHILARSPANWGPSMWKKYWTTQH